MCSDHSSATFIWRFRKAFSLAASVSLQGGCGLCRLGRIGMRYFIGLPKTNCAGDSFVPASIRGVTVLEVCTTHVEMHQCQGCRLGCYCFR